MRSSCVWKTAFNNPGMGNCFLFSVSVSVLLRNISCYPENYWATRFLISCPASRLRRYNVK
jgi:hypothetical protein